MNDSKGIGRNIANLRKYKRLTQSELAKNLDLSKGHIAAIEEGRKRPSIKTLLLIASYFGVRIEDLLN